MKDIINESFEIGLEIVNKIKTTQIASIEKTASLIADAHHAGHKFFVSGSGHSHSVAEEFYGRAGGLAFVVPIMTSELTLTEHPTKSTYLENLSGYANILIELYGVTKGDVVLIASNSGRNAYPVELAIEAKKRGASVVAITNTKHSLGSEPRNIHKKRLMEVADVVIDNCGEIGDSASYFSGIDVPMYPTSSIANAFICGAISVGVARGLVNCGDEVEVFISANVDGGFEKNETYMKKYARLYK